MERDVHFIVNKGKIFKQGAARLEGILIGSGGNPVRGQSSCIPSLA